MAAGTIFINYRRDDSRADAGRLYDRLEARYPGRIFRDVGSLGPGIEWHDAIATVLGTADACIVVIGRNWLGATNSAGTRRLDDPRDTVRQEILTALNNGIRVFPVLVGDAQMPTEEQLPPDLRPLARRNALEITEQDWDEDFNKLVRAIEGLVGWDPKTASPILRAEQSRVAVAGRATSLVSTEPTGRASPVEPTCCHRARRTTVGCRHPRGHGRAALAWQPWLRCISSRILELVEWTAIPGEDRGHCGADGIDAAERACACLATVPGTEESARASCRIDDAVAARPLAAAGFDGDRASPTRCQAACRTGFLRRPTRQSDEPADCRA
jgi:hypothetical protein